MARRFSASEKGKGIAQSPEHPPRKRIRVPETDTSDLIKENSPTLVGRLTNPREQRMWTMLPFLTNKWGIKGQAVGSDLGNSCFQFRFEKEEDLEKVIANRPYHYARWMLIVQRWEPIISASFPSSIPFWVRLRGLPLHYWKEDLITQIGKELGDFKRLELTKTSAKVRISVNGLEPLIMETVLDFANGDETVVSMEYEGLAKHCRFCFKLTHEEESCPDKVPRRSPPRRQNELPETRAPLQPKNQHGSDTRRNYSERRDRYGQSFGTRPSQGTPREHYLSTRQHGTRGRGTERQKREEIGDSQPPYKNQNYLNREDNSTGQTYQLHREPPISEYPHAREQIWREKRPYKQVSQDYSNNNYSRPFPLERNLEREAFSETNTPPQPLRTGPTAESIMEELQDVTVRYINCGDPVESAARLQRVIESETRGLMAETTASMLAAAELQQQATQNQSQQTVLHHTTPNHNPTAAQNLEILPEEEARTLPTMPKRRGRPPKRATPRGANSKSLLMQRTQNSPRTKKPPFRVVSPFKKPTTNAEAGPSNAPRPPRQQATPNQRPTVQLGDDGNTISLRPTRKKTIPAKQRDADFHDLQDPLP